MTSEEIRMQKQVDWICRRDATIKRISDSFSVSIGIVWGIYLTMDLFFKADPQPVPLAMKPSIV